MGETLAAEATPSAKITFTEFNVRQDTGRPHFIRLCDDVVERLQREPAIKRGEAFGILLGTVELDQNCTITVEGFEPAGVVEQHIRAWTPRPGSAQEVVGYYRSHSRTDFTLDEADRALFERCFPKDARVALLVRPPKPGSGTGAFYLGEGGSLDENRVTVEFPFDLRQLTAEEAPAETSSASASKSKGLLGGLFAKIAITGVAIAASVVGLSALGVFDGSASSSAADGSDLLEIPKPQPPAAPVFILPPEKKPVSAAAPKLKAQAVPDPIRESIAADPSLFDTPPYPMRQFAPILSDSARQALRGEVVVHMKVNVDASGAVTAAEPAPESLSIAEPLLAAATTAVKRWKFEPAQRSGRKVAGQTVLSFTFRK